MTNINDGTVSVIDTAVNSVIASITIGQGPVSGEGPAGVAISPDGTRAYVSNFSYTGSAVSVIDTATDTQ